jgi:hypothetical protein
MLNCRSKENWSDRFGIFMPKKTAGHYKTGMNWIDKLLGKRQEIKATSTEVPNKSTVTQPKKVATESWWPEGIRFGRYGDNNKSVQKTQSWYKAEELFREKKYTEAFAAFFDYLRDEEEDNVFFQQNAERFSFIITQGSKRIHGDCDGITISARAPLAVMETPGTAVMRRLLDLNYALYYSHSALDGGTGLYMVFSADVPSANPSKLYYGLRELATKADRQDDLLLADFPSLKPMDTDHIKPIPVAELEIKYKYFRKWTEETLNKVAEVNQDSFSGAIAYLLLGLIFRIDFLILPESKLLLELEKINKLYWEKKDDVPLVERNQMMRDSIKKLLDISKEDFSKNLYRSKGCFSIATPAKADKVKDHIIGANKDSRWYIENKYPEIALLINEYGMLYNEFIFSMPQVQTDLTIIYCAVIHADFFEELGMKKKLYDAGTKLFDKESIMILIDQATGKFADKYKSMHWDHDRVSYDNLYDFGISFSEHMANLNLETKRI